MSTRLEDEVREALWSSTERLSTPPDAYARVMGVVEAERRRRRATVAGAALTAALLAGVVAVSTGVLDAEQRASSPATERVVDRAPDWGYQADWPARGPLGTDAEFADEFTRLYGTDHRLLYAEDGEAGRVVIAISATSEAVVFYGPAGADLAALQRASGLQVESREVVVAVPRGDSHLILILLPEILNDAQFSTPAVARDGSIARTWRQIPVENGIGRMVTSDPIGVIRVATPAGDGPPHVVVDGEPPGTLSCDRCSSEWFSHEGLAEFRHHAAAAVSEAEEDIEARVLFDGAVDDSRVVALVATLPAGGLLRATYLVTDEDAAPTVTMVEPLRPLPADDDTRPILIPRGTVPNTADAVLVAPGASRIAFTPLRDAPAVGDVNLTDGVATVSSAPGDLSAYRLTAYDAEGAERKSWRGSVLHPSDPFQLFTRGWTGRAG